MKDSFLEAVKALQKYFKNNPEVYDTNGRWVGVRRWVQPCESDTKTTRRFVYLSNINGLIAKYNRTTGEITI